MALTPEAMAFDRGLDLSFGGFSSTRSARRRASAPRRRSMSRSKRWRRRRSKASCRTEKRLRTKAVCAPTISPPSYDGKRIGSSSDVTGGRRRFPDMAIADQEVPRSRKLEGVRFLDLGSFGGRCLHLGSELVSGEYMPRPGNRCLDLGMDEMPRCGYEIPISRKICLDLGSACPVKQTVRHREARSISTWRGLANRRIIRTIRLGP